jgi:hypothetical protein
MKMTSPVLDVSQREVVAGQIMRLQVALSRFEQVDMPVRHYFSPGLYCREIIMPAGAFVVGKLHATEHPNIISHGDCSVWTAQDGLQRIKAPYTWISKAGVKKALYIHETTVWTTIHVTDKTDLTEIEKDMIIDQPLLGDFTDAEADALALALQGELRAVMKLEHMT